MMIPREYALRARPQGLFSGLEGVGVKLLVYGGGAALAGLGGFLAMTPASRGVGLALLVGGAGTIIGYRAWQSYRVDPIGTTVDLAAFASIAAGAVISWKKPKDLNENAGLMLIILGITTFLGHTLYRSLVGDPFKPNEENISNQGALFVQTPGSGECAGTLRVRRGSSGPVVPDAAVYVTSYYGTGCNEGLGDPGRFDGKNCEWTYVGQSNSFGELGYDVSQFGADAHARFFATEGNYKTNSASSAEVCK